MLLDLLAPESSIRPFGPNGQMDLLISMRESLKKDYSFPNRLTNIERSSCQNRIAQDSATIWNVGWFGRETLFCRCCQVIRTIHGLHFLISRSFENPKRTRSAQVLPEAFRNAVMQTARQVLNTGPDSTETISNHIRGLL